MNAVLADARRGHPGLYWSALGMAALAVVLAALAVLDQRVLMGAPLWFKPLKFAISFAAYFGALAWMLGQLRVPTMRRTGWVVVAALVVEQAIIVGQAARGERSHFNVEEPENSLLFSIMGASIVVLYLATIAIALRFLREPGRDRPGGLAIRLGLGIGIVGLSVGIVMTVVGSHSVGGPDGGPGLAFLGWSTTGGDLRVGHFIGMHALQALPLLAAVLAAVRLDPTTRTRIVVAAAAGYLGVVLVVTWQALRGLPLLAPDPATTGALSAVVLGAGATAVLALRGRTPANPRTPTGRP